KKVSAKRTAAEPTATPPASEDPAPAAAKAKKPTKKPIRTRPVRLSVDLAPQVYRSLTALLTGELAERTGLARVSQGEVIRILVEKLTTASDVQEYVIAELIARADQ